MDKKDFSHFLKEAFFISWENDSILMGWKKSKELTKSNNKILFYFPDFFLSQKKFSTFNKSLLLSRKDFKKLILKIHQKTKKKSLKNELKKSLNFKKKWVLPKKKIFLEKVKKIKKQILKGELIKALPVTYEVCEDFICEEEKSNLLLSLLQNQIKGGLIYGFWNKNEGTIGMSPEILFDWNGKRKTLFSMALAGTALKCSKNSLLDDPKEIEEHLNVVSDLMEKLEKLGSVWKSKTYEWSYGVLKHLRTDFFLKLKYFSSTKINLNTKINFKELKKNPIKIVEWLHPTPAMGLFSKKLNKKQMDEIEKTLNPHRKHFGAPFGVFLPKEKRFFCLIAIRNLQWFNNKTYIMSGCGLIEKSNPNKEWEELKWKRNSVKKLFNF